MIKKLLLMVAFVATAIGFAQTTPTITWTGPAFTTLTIGTSYTFTSDYNAGDDGNGINYTVSNPSGANNLQYSIQIKTTPATGSPTYKWKDGVNDAAAKSTHSGSSTKAWVIPGTLVPTASLAANESYVLRVGYQNSNSVWATGAIEQNITIVASSGDAWLFDANPMVFTSNTTLNVPIKYTSDSPIAVDGIKFIFWTETRGLGTDGTTNLFSDVWHGAVSNTTILPAGTNLSTTIPVTIPAALINSTTGKMYLSSDLGNVFDPNAGDAGNNYINHATTPAPTYTFTFRVAAGTDSNFTPTLPGGVDYTVTNSTLGLKDNKFNNLNVSPNPTSGLINLGDFTGAKNITVSNITGQTVKTFKAQSSINIENLVPGIYIIKTDNGKTAKIVKK